MGQCTRLAEQHQWALAQNTLGLADHALNDRAGWLERADQASAHTGATIHSADIQRLRCRPGLLKQLVAPCRRAARSSARPSLLRRAFLATGLPRQISFDRGTVFFDNTTTSPFPTRLHLWLLALGVEVSFTRIRRPTEHGHVERVHQTMTLQALLGQSWSDATALWAGLDARRSMLNAHIPCRMLGGRAPLQAYPEAGQSGRFYRPEWETELMDLTGVYGYLGTCRWFRRVAQNGSVAIGGIYYYINPKYRGSAIEVTFDAERALFRGHLAGLPEVVDIIPRGLTKAALMGEVAAISALPVYQLALPFTHEAQRVMDYLPLVRRMTLCDFAS